MTITVPIKTVSELNRRGCGEHWGTRARRVRAQKDAVAWMWQTIPQAERLALAQAVDGRGLIITFTRIAPRKLDGEDNLNSSMKSIRDQIAKQLAVNDNTDKIVWRYGQERGRKKEYAVRVVLEAR